MMTIACIEQYSCLNILTNISSKHNTGTRIIFVLCTQFQGTFPNYMCSVLMPLNIQRTFIELFMQLKFIMRMPKMAHCCWVFRRQRNLPEPNSMTIYVCIKCTYRHIITLFQRNLFQCNSTKKGNHKFSTKKIPCKYRQFVSLLNFPWNEPPSCWWC